MNFDIAHFKKQYLAEMLIDLPTDLVEELTADLSEWLYWKKSQLENFNLLPSQIEFLSQIGLPKVSAEINFEQFDKDLIFEILKNHDLDKTYFPLGFDGSGSIVFLHIVDGGIFLCDHDNGNEMVFINSSLEQLAETLVYVAKIFIQKIETDRFADLAKIDKKAGQKGDFWYWALQNR